MQIQRSARKRTNEVFCSLHKFYQRKNEPKPTQQVNINLFREFWKSDYLVHLMVQLQLPLSRSRSKLGRVSRESHKFQSFHNSITRTSLHQLNERESNQLKDAKIFRLKQKIFFLKKSRSLLFCPFHPRSILAGSDKR